MARLNSWRLTVVMVLGAVALGAAVLGTVGLGAAAPSSKSAPAQQGTKELATAGTCARCHVSSTLEWGISKHAQRAGKAAKAGETGAAARRLPNCVGCHGESRDHVVDEQNTFKPDRVARGDAIATLCVECHRRGCPNARDLKNCQNCHDVHALINPKLDAKKIETRAKELTQLQEAYKGHLAEGEKLLQQAKWEPARTAFTAALRDNPGGERAPSALRMIARRLKPEIPGFKIVGDQFDAASGLPKEIVMEGLGIDMILAPAGSFDMGSDGRPDTAPRHTVSLGAFYLAKTDMTQGQWKTLMGTNPSYYQGAKFPQADHFPVEQVSWKDCQAMLAAVNKRIAGGAGVRLPTEAEWEYAALAGGSETFDAGTVLSSAWLRENSQIAPTVTINVPSAPPAGTVAKTGSATTPGASPGPGGGRGGLGRGGAVNVEAAKLEAPDHFAPHVVGTAKPNRWGLYDMEGNVSVWCSSLALPYPYSMGDGREAAEGAGPRVVRGATFVDTVDAADPTFRHSDRPDRKLRWVGVRLAFSPPEPVIATPAVQAAP
jgi:formylglycine-generating enzyme required for sulfatase activity